MSQFEDQQEAVATAHWYTQQNDSGNAINRRPFSADRRRNLQLLETCLALDTLDTVARPTRRGLYPKIPGKKKRKNAVNLPLADLAKASVVNQYGLSKINKNLEKEKALRRKTEEESFTREALRLHNEYRCLHGSPNLHISEKLCAHAREWANEIAAKDMMYHGKCVLANGDVIGENVFTCWTSDGNTDALARDAVRCWYAEEKHYNYDKPAENSFKTHQFTQLVWKDSKQLGMAWARSNEGSTYVVAIYSPAGNKHGTFVQNVVQPLCLESLETLTHGGDDSDSSDSDMEIDLLESGVRLDSSVNNMTVSQLLKSTGQKAKHVKFADN